MARFTAKQTQSRGAETALSDERGETSWSAFDERVNRLISAMRQAGLETGDVIGIFAGNCREYYEVMTAACHMGVVYVPVNWHFTSDELQYVVDNSGCKMLFVEAQFDAPASPVTQVNGVDLTRVGIRSGAEGFLDFEAFLGDGLNEEPENQTLGGPMFYTSGTTGRPKGVRSSTSGQIVPMEVMEMMGAGISGMLSIPSDGKTYICGPVYHSAQWAFSFLPLYEWYRGGYASSVRRRRIT